MSALLPTIGGSILALYGGLIHRTCPLTLEGWEHVETAQRSGRPIIFANWHGQTHLFYKVFASRFDLGNAYLVMVGDARRGVLGHFARLVGARAFPVDMQDDSMAGARNLLELTRLLGPGKLSYISPDGPDGPARVAKGGVAFIAQRAQALIIPVGNAARFTMHLPRWDRYNLPLPFDRIHTVFGEPIEAPRKADRDAILETLSRELNRADARALELMKEKPTTA